MMVPSVDGRIVGYEGVEEVYRRFGDCVIDAHLPNPGTPTQPGAAVATGGRERSQRLLPGEPLIDARFGHHRPRVGHRGHRPPRIDGERTIDGCPTGGQQREEEEPTHRRMVGLRTGRSKSVARRRRF
jgi:hypothetical protein